MIGVFQQIKIRTFLGALLATSIFSVSIVASATEEKSEAILVLEAQISTLKSQRFQNVKHIQKDLLPQFDKGGPDWKPIDSMVMHELNNEITDYGFIRSNGHGSQLGEMQDQMVDLLAASGSFDDVRDQVLAVMVQNLTAKNAVQPAERKVYLNQMRFQLGLSESKHLRALLEELHSTRAKVASIDRKLNKLKMDLEVQIKLDMETKN